ncbi:signal protein [Janthinobacterium sp.]|uniref:signal protein n=1 Tax=Janthinobacterium sp. TaxID=1871054 RepID=UPI00293D3731|nr:signal protein [Janthinobacterium sp.]
MKLFVKSLALSAGLLLSVHGFAQNSTATHSTKPAASTPAPAAMNKTQVANPVAPETSATTATPAKTVAKSASAPASASAAPGGGDGKVWVNSKSKVYHCPGTKFYGKTKTGEYMSEADAKTKGNHPNNKKACS